MALLAYPEGDTLVQTVAFEVALLGNPARHSHLGILANLPLRCVAAQSAAVD